MPKSATSELPLLKYIDDLVDDLRKNVPRAMKHWNADAVHQARVATRRLKAALDLLEPVLSQEHVKPFSNVLKKLRRRLGPMRDLDVMIDHLADLKAAAAAPAVKWLSGRLIAQRDAAREASRDKGSTVRVLSRLGTWWGLREEVEEGVEATDTLLAASLHAQLDTFAEQADRLSAPTPHRNRQDPHAVRIAGKSFRYTLEMASAAGHELPAGIMKSFKRMQEALGMWHDYVVLSERAMQVSLEDLLAHHDAALQGQILDLAKMLLRRSTTHMSQFSELWLKNGGEVAKAVRLTFPLTKSVDDAPRLEPAPTTADSNADVDAHANGTHAARA